MLKMNFYKLKHFYSNEINNSVGKSIDNSIEFHDYNDADSFK